MPKSFWWCNCWLSRVSSAVLAARLCLPFYPDHSRIDFKIWDLSLFFLHLISCSRGAKHFFVLNALSDAAEYLLNNQRKSSPFRWTHSTSSYIAASHHLHRNKPVHILIIYLYQNFKNILWLLSLSTSIPFQLRRGIHAFSHGTILATYLWPRHHKPLCFNVPHGISNIHSIITKSNKTRYICEWSHWFFISLFKSFFS